jgi:hypothetical protein
LSQKIYNRYKYNIDIYIICPNLNNIEMKNKFMSLVTTKLNRFVGLTIPDLNNKQKIIDEISGQ